MVDISKKAVIAGYDAVSPLGTTMDTQWNNAINGESGIGALSRFPINDKFPVRIAGEVSDIDASPYPFLGQREMAHWTSPIFKHAMLVVHRALENSGIEITPEIAPRTAITFSSAVGGLDAVLKADRRMIAENKLPHPFTNPNSCINMVGGKVSILTKATGPIVSSITACATGSTSMIMGALFLERGMADVAICGAVDFCLVEPIVAGFATMNGAYKAKPGAPEEAPGEASRPFSANRRGFVVSEGAGCVILTTPEFAKAHGLDCPVELAGWGMTSDAHHFVAPNLDTVKQAINGSIKTAGIQPGDIDSVNAHGTSTKIGDTIEAQALRDIFGSSVPPVTANKSLTGHAMGASSAIESIYAMKGMVSDTILPTINYNPDPELELDSIVQETGSIKQEFLLKNAFGFGGCNSCLVFRRVG
ncbi:MAG: beta-ketoacyl-[acyl-carrier-protein] synthase family protein [bacterium]|nr:beta-ketoacyl-[acyl-carrier-protein] synthase family protein [bacterium]